MRLETKKYLLDIQVAAERVERFCRGKTFKQYLADEMLRSAVDDRIVWGVIEIHLDSLRKAVAGLIAKP